MAWLIKERGAYLVVSDFVEFENSSVAGFLVGANNCNHPRLRVICQVALGELSNLPQQFGTKKPTQLLDPGARPLRLHEALQ
jgi:hypothetical protein